MALATTAPQELLRHEKRKKRRRKAKDRNGTVSKTVLERNATLARPRRWWQPSKSSSKPGVNRASAVEEQLRDEDLALHEPQPVSSDRLGIGYLPRETSDVRQTWRPSTEVLEVFSQLVGGGAEVLPEGFHLVEDAAA